MLAGKKEVWWGEKKSYLLRMTFVHVSAVPMACEVFRASEGGFLHNPDELGVWEGMLADRDDTGGGEMSGTVRTRDAEYKSEFPAQNPRAVPELPLELEGVNPLSNAS